MGLQDRSRFVIYLNFESKTHGPGLVHYLVSGVVLWRRPGDLRAEFCHDPSDRDDTNAREEQGVSDSNNQNTSSPDEQTTDPLVDPWVARLRGESGVRDAALSELRGILLRGLTKSMGSRYGGGYQAEDVAQEALLKILDSLDQFAGRSKFTTWAMTVATRIGISEMRRKHYQDVSIEAFQGDGSTKIDVAVDDSDSSAQTVDRLAIVRQLQQLIDQSLTEKQRFAIRASLEGLPVEVIADKSGSNRNSVYKLVHDARMKLRAGLESAGINADEIAVTFA